MDIPVTQLPPGDPRLVEAIVGQLKSRGIFDQFRKECLADVDLKPAYQNLRQRVEGQVNKFLEKQIWKNDLNKNQLRESVRKHVHDAGMLGPGIDAIISQVVNPKINSLILPLVEDTVYAFLQIDKPKRESKVLSEPEKDIMNYHRDQNGQHHHHHPPIMPKPPAPPPARVPLIPMDTDAISSEEDEILAHESPESEKRTSDDEKMELQMMDDNARDGFEDKSKVISDAGLYGPDSVVESVEKLKIKEEPTTRAIKEESTSQEPVKPPMLLFDNQSLDSISSNSSGLTFSPLSGRGSVKDEKIDDEGETSPPPSCEVRGEKQETGQNSNRSTPLIDEIKVEEGGSVHDIGSQLSQDLRTSRVRESLDDVDRGSSKEVHPPEPEPSRLPSLPPELPKEGNGKTISGASPISLDEDSEMSKCSQGTNSSRGEKSEGELSSKSEGEISSKSLRSEGEVSGKSGRTEGETKSDKVDKEPSIKSEKSEGEITSSSDSESRDTRDSYKPKRPEERHGSREDRHRSDGHRHKHDSRSSKERERDREKEKKRDKSKDDHHLYKDKDRKHDRRDRDRDRDRSRGHHHSSSSRKESSSSSSDRRDKERSGHYSSDRSSKEGKSRSGGSSEKHEKKKVENKDDQGKGDLKVEEKKREIKSEKSSDKGEIKKETKSDIKKPENKNKGDVKKSDTKKLDIKQEEKQDKTSKDKLNKIKNESKDKKENTSIKSSKYPEKDKKEKRDKDKKTDDKTSSKKKTGDRKTIEKKQIIVSLGKDRPLDKEPKNSFSKDIKKSKIASNNNEIKTLNKAQDVSSTKNSVGCDVDFSSYGIDSEPMVLVSNDGNLLFVNYSEEEKKKNSQQTKSSSSDSDGCLTPPLVDAPKPQTKQISNKREVRAPVVSIPLKKRKEMNKNKEDNAETLKPVANDTKKAEPKKRGPKRKGKDSNFEGFEVFERDTKLRTFLDSVVVIPDPLEEEDMQAEDYFMVVSETQLPENVSVDDFVKQVEWMGVRVNHRKLDKNGAQTAMSKGEEPEAPSNGSRTRNRKRQASMSSTASNSSTSSTSGSSPKVKRMRRNIRQGKEKEEEEVMCLEDDRTNTDVLMAGYALPTPEDDGHRTSTREYEVDYSRRESSYSPLSPSSDSSEDTKAKATAGVCGAPTLPEFWKSHNSKQHPHQRQASLLISLNCLSKQSHLPKECHGRNGVFPQILYEVYWQSFCG
ncbi:uncharacterized protein LOC143036561 isoform X2 [Oratosquilla oratoria]|uniref:uncharacterized protein LOC143036561 isoform X2 n=1 Tax=Oratosquilla oratoria TaxID=337810 RepID=UPI003F764086